MLFLFVNSTILTWHVYGHQEGYVNQRQYAYREPQQEWFARNDGFYYLQDDPIARHHQHNIAALIALGQLDDFHPARRIDRCIDAVESTLRVCHLNLITVCQLLINREGDMLTFHFQPLAKHTYHKYMNVCN